MGKCRKTEDRKVPLLSRIVRNLGRKLDRHPTDDEISMELEKISGSPNGLICFEEEDCAKEEIRRKC